MNGPPWRASRACAAPARDTQKSRVYAWEDREIAPRDASTIAFAQAQGLVEAIWREQGLLYPPLVAKLPRQARALVADANRLQIRLPPQAPSWCVLHEIAHAMSTTMDGVSDGHGPLFMGLYIRLLSDYLRLNRDELLGSLARDGIAIAPDSRPIFCD